MASQLSFNFNNCNYVVTGASSGIGRQITIELINSGACVLAIARDKNKLSALQKDVSSPSMLHTCSVDVCDNDSIEEVIKSFVKERGKLSGSVHAAGILNMTFLKNYSAQTAKEIMEINFWAGINLVKIATNAKYGVMTSNVLLSSVCAKSHELGEFAYSASKSAINSAVSSIAKEISKKHHRINSIMPGWCDTPMTKKIVEEYGLNLDEIEKQSLLGLGHVEDISGLVLFLLSDRAKWITGSHYVIDGGYSA